MPILALLGWVPLSLCLFMLMRPRAAMLASLIGAWLFLPIYGIKVNVLPDLTKVTVSTFAALLGVMLFDFDRLTTFRFRWFDWPMLIWCICPFVSSITNGLGAWDGGSAILEKVAIYGIPYYLGRVYFTDWAAIRELAIAVFIGGLIYVPLCLFEIKFSPVLHKWVYGFWQHQIAQAYRFGGWRPMVFMQHGLAVGFWMTAASLVGVWLWMSGSVKQLGGLPMGLLVVALVGTTFLCKSAAGLGFLAGGLVVLYAIQTLRTALPLYLLLAIAPVYMTARSVGGFTGQSLIRLATRAVGEERAQSLSTRINAENLLTARGLQAPYFGWARWDPNDSAHPKWRVYDEETGKDLAVTDGMWVITLGTTGLVGLASATTAILLPAFLVRRRIPVEFWGHPMAAGAAALSVMLALHMLDNLLNAMLNPVFVLAMGALSSAGCVGATSVAVPATPGMQRGVGMSPPPAARARQRPRTPTASASSMQAA